MTISSLNYDLFDSYSVSMSLVSQIFEDNRNTKITPTIEKTNIPLIRCE